MLRRAVHLRAARVFRKCIRLLSFPVWGKVEAVVHKWVAALRAKALAVACIWLALVGAEGSAWACPQCQVGIEARATIFRDAFWTRLAWVMAPFAILAIVVALLYRIGLKPKRTQQPQG